MGRRTHGPHLLAAIDANDHAKVHEILAVQVRNKVKIREVCTADVKRLASENIDCPLLLAAVLPDPTIVRYMISKHGVDVNLRHQRGVGRRVKLHTPLMVAVKRGRHHTVEILLELNANTNIQDHKGRTALHQAVYAADYRIAKMLLTKGAQPNLADRCENSPLHVAAKFGHLELVKLLMQYGGDLYRRGQHGAIPLHIAAKEGHISLIEWFVRHGGSVNAKIPCFAEMREKTPLHVACEEGHVEAVMTLVQRCGADVNMPDSEGETPLHCTVLHEYDPFGMKSKDDYADTALVLLKFGADANKKNDRGETALHHAARNEFQKVVELLVRAGADPLAEDLDKNKAVDLVSDDDAVTRNLLKRAVDDREKLMSELLEIKARGFSTSSQSLNLLMMNGGAATSANAAASGMATPTTAAAAAAAAVLSQSMMNIPSLNQGLLSRTNSSPGIFPSDGLVYTQDGYLQPFGSRPRLGSIGSQASFGIQSFAGMPLARQDSIGSFHSAMTAPVNTYCSIDSDGVLSESAAAGVIAPRLIRKRRGGSGSAERRGGGHQKLPQHHPEPSSDSSQYEDIPYRTKHSTPRRSASVDVIQSDGKARTPKQPFMIHPTGKSSGKKSKALSRSGRTRRSQTSLASQGSCASTASQHSAASTVDSTDSSLWDGRSYTSQSTLKADNDETSECNTSSRSTPDGCPTPRTPTDHLPSVGGDDLPDGGDIYENVPHDSVEPTPVHTSGTATRLPADKPSLAVKKPAPDRPPRTRRPLPPIPKESEQLAAKPLPPSPAPPVAQGTPTPIGGTGDRSSQEITIKISPHQSITIRTTPSGQTQAIQVNSLLPEDQPSEGDQETRLNYTSDSDDTFFDDESFDTISDLLETDRKKTKPIPPPKPSHLRSKKKRSAEQMKKMLADPKLEKWLADQALLLKQRDTQQGQGPIAQSTPPMSRRELENKLRLAFGKPPLSDAEEPESPDSKKVAAVAQFAQKSTGHGDETQRGNEPLAPSEDIASGNDSIVYTDMNDLSDPVKGRPTLVPPSRQPPLQSEKLETSPTGINQKENQGSTPSKNQWEKVSVGDPSHDTSATSLYWDHSEDTIQRAKPTAPGRQLSSGTETVYMEMNGSAKKVLDPAADPKQPSPRKAVQKEPLEVPEGLLPGSPLQPARKPVASVSTKPKVAPDSDDFDGDDSFDSFDDESDDEGIPNSCHQVAVHFRQNSQNDGPSNLVLTTPNGELVSHTRHSSTNAHCVPVPGAGEMAEKTAGRAPPSPRKGSLTPKTKSDIVVVRDAALVNGMPINQATPNVLNRSNSVQEQRNAHLVSAIAQGPAVLEAKISGEVQDPEGTPAQSTPSRLSSEKSADLSDLRTRKVTIGSEEIKLIPDQDKLPKDHDHREVEYDTKGKMRITLIGGNSDGIFIHRIDPGSDAEQKGLMEGDQLLKVNGLSTNGRTKEEVTLQLMSLQQTVRLLVRHKKDRYNGIVQNGGMGDAFFVKAFFNHDPAQKGELKIKDGDIFSVRDTLPSGRMGSWRALKVNAKPNEDQHGLIPNESRAEQVALASRKAGDRGRGLEKEHRGSFIRRSLRRSKSADRLHKEQEAFTKSQTPQLEETRTYERVEQRTPGFLRPVIILGLFCDTVRDRMLQDLPGLFEKPPPEVEIPTTAEAGDVNKVPVDVRIIHEIIAKNRHPLMIMSPRAIQYLHSTKLYPIVIYLVPSSKDVVKKIRHNLAPGYTKRSGYMYDESQSFSRTYSHLFTATVSYTADDSWYALLKDTIQRIQNQPLWQTVDSSVRGQSEGSPHGSPSGSVTDSEKIPRLASSARIPDPIRNILQRHAGGGDTPTGSLRDVTDLGAARPRQLALTYDGYFLSDSREEDARQAGVGPPGTNGQNTGIGGRAAASGSCRSLDEVQLEKPRSILKNNKGLSSQGGPIPNGQSALQDVSPPQKYQQIGLMVPMSANKRQEENNNAVQRRPTAQKLTEQQMMQQMILQQQHQQQQQQLAMAQHQQQQQQMLIQQMFQQQFMQQTVNQQQMAAESRGLRRQNVETDL